MRGLHGSLPGKWLFLLMVLALYGVAALFSPGLAAGSLAAFTGIVYSVLPVFALMFGMLFLANLLLTPRRVSAHLGGESGKRGWLVAIGAGILSIGPIYMWFPLLADMRKKGMSSSLVAVFLFNRAVKIPFIPLMVFYFGWGYVALLTALMIGFSVINGLVVGILTEVEA